jgi:hypothetical protein
LIKDGWESGRKATHGITLTKKTSDRTLVTFIPDKKISLPEGTLHAILGVKQTQLGKSGLLRILNSYGLD